MKRREIVDEAKRIVLAYGPSNCLQFADEMVNRRLSYSIPAEDLAPIIAEVRIQAERVYRFLGYLPD